MSSGGFDLVLDGGEADPAFLTSRMDGPATHLPQLLKHPGGAPLSSTRCAHATLPLDWNLSTPLDQDLFELINRLQSSRLGKNLYSLYTLIFFSLKYTHYCHAPPPNALVYIFCIHVPPQRYWFLLQYSQQQFGYFIFSLIFSTEKKITERAIFYHSFLLQNLPS